MAGIVSLQHPDVNNGNAVILNGVSVKYVWKNLYNKEPVPGKFDIVEVDVAGFENPYVSLNGIIDIDTDKTTSEHLKSFSRIEFTGESTSAIKFFIGTGNQETLLDGSISSSDSTITVDSTEGAGSTGTIRIGNEIISYTGTTSTSFTGCTRGVAGTTAASASDNAIVNILGNFTSSDSSSQFMYVIVQNFNISFNTQVKEGQKWTYTLELTETEVDN